MRSVCFVLTNNTSQTMRFQIEPETWPKADLPVGKQLWTTGQYEKVPITVSFTAEDHVIYGQIWSGEGDVNMEVKDEEPGPWCKPK